MKRLAGVLIGAILMAGSPHAQRRSGPPIAPLPGDRRLTVQRLARSTEPGVVERLVGHLDDGDPFARREAASALAQRLHGRGGDPDVALARLGLQNRLTRDTGDTEDVRTMLQALGELPYGTSEADEVEKYLVAQTLPSDPPHPVRRLAAVEGLEALIRLDRRREPSPATIVRLRQLAVPGVGAMAVAEPLLPAMQALVAANDRDAATLHAAARYRCKGTVAIGCGWEFRRLAADLIDAADAEFADDVRHLLEDAAFQVRIEALRAVARRLDVSTGCEPLVDALDDPRPVVAFEATKLLDTRCEHAQQIGERLERIALDLSNPMKTDEWMLPVHALEALARFSSAKAKPIVRGIALHHAEWAVRAAAARIAASLREPDIAEELTADPEPKVRIDALSALRKLEFADLPRLARDELARLRPPAMSSAKLPDVGSLWLALSILKDRAELSDVSALFDVVSLPVTARMARLEALARLMELAQPRDSVSRLRDQVHLFDFYMKRNPPDAPVSSACARIIEIITGIRPGFSAGMEFPSMYGMPNDKVIVTMSTGDQVVLQLRGDEAPGIVNRFIGRIMDTNDGFKGTVFHRVLPNALVQGGSRSGSDWAATPCEMSKPVPTVADVSSLRGVCNFWKDEFNPLRHDRGAVALATNGPDTGIGQVFVNLVDNPSYNHEYTVFAHVVCVKPVRPIPYVTDDPMDLVDRLQEGDQIQRIARAPSQLDLGSFKCAAGVQ